MNANHAEHLNSLRLLDAFDVETQPFSSRITFFATTYSEQGYGIKRLNRKRPDAANDETQHCKSMDDQCSARGSTKNALSKAG